ncbi:MAG: zinc-ribbon domain-containing protein [Deltaproteobacteria bacterium]|nr:zinc-ribbon domain-containing protein [Candidatus Zymogenaceae bacterium]
MQITCPQCGASGNLSDKLIPTGGRAVNCPRCKSRFWITGTASAAPITPPTTSPIENLQQPTADPPRENHKTITVDEYIAQQCSGCGALVNVPKEKRSTRCEHCGGIVALPPPLSKPDASKIENYISLAELAEVSQNWPEAYRYWALVLEIDLNNASAWIGKGRAAGMVSCINESRLSEMTACLRRAVERAGHDKKEEIVRDAVAVIGTVATGLARPIGAMQSISPLTFFAEPFDHEFSKEKRHRVCLEILEAFKLAHELAPTDQGTIDAAVFLCQKGFGGAEEKIAKGRDGYFLYFAIEGKKLNPTYAPLLTQGGVSCVLLVLVAAIFSFFGTIFYFIL